MHKSRSKLQSTLQIIYVVSIYLVSPARCTLHGIKEDILASYLTDYEVIEPFVSNEFGEFLSHDLRDGHGFKPQVLRKKRDVENEQIINIGAGTTDIFGRHPDAINLYNDIYKDNYDSNTTTQRPHTRPIRKRLARHYNDHTIVHDHVKHVYYNVSAFGSHFHLRLRQKQRLIAPGAKAVWYGETADTDEDIDTSCVYSGLIRHHHDSRVALTSCDGLSGIIKTSDDEFFIEPIESRINTSMGPGEIHKQPQRHVIYRRSAVVTDLVGMEMGHGEKSRVERSAEDYRTRPRNSLHGDTLAAAITNHHNGINQIMDYSRLRRHTSSDDYSMEVLLTADSSVVEFHKKEHVTFYLVTLLNIVDEIYHDESLGSHVNIVLVKLCLLDRSQSEDMIVIQNPQASLQNVCEWANELAIENPSPTGKRHDHAIFLTRRNFGPAGYAHVASMCQPLRSCSLSVEDGFSSAFVVAHEIGHSLGMEHDGEANKCGDETSMGSIMAPLVQAAFHRYHWSRCSQQEFNAFIGKATCLLDDPEQTEDYGPRPLYPGIRYSVDDQCRFDFGEGFQLCTSFSHTDVCRVLWCSHVDNPLFCKTRNGGPVDGTSCGENRICFQNHCVWNDQGNWGPWSHATECSRTCGVGSKIRTRTCNNGRAGREGCEGKSTDYILCNKEPCPRPRDFREQQCRDKNKQITYRGQRHTWLPIESDGDLKCELYCESKQTHDVVSMVKPVVDGTPCSYHDPHGICLGGKCVKIGCDKVLGSSMREDECGICGGNGRLCRRFTGTYKRPSRRGVNGYYTMFTLPLGARKIKIVEDAYPYNKHILALKVRRKGRYLLNNRGQLFEGDIHSHFIASNTLWEYSSENDTETITASGPIAEDIAVLMVSKGKGIRTSVRFSYVLHPKHVRNTVYKFEIRRRGQCSVTCGSGFRSVRYGCRNKNLDRWVRMKHCSAPRPSAKREECTIACKEPAMWQIGDWGECTYGACGVPGTQQRTVACRAPNGNGIIRNVNPALCSGSPRPTTRRHCSARACPCTWRKGAWSTCSQTCGEGFQRRRVLCRCGNSAASAHRCGHDTPDDVKTCIDQPCEEEVCKTDKSQFCKLDEIAHYCSLEGYRKLCCKSCEAFSQAHGPPSSSLGSLPSLGFHERYANLTEIIMSTEEDLNDDEEEEINSDLYDNEEGGYLDEDDTIEDSELRDVTIEATDAWEEDSSLDRSRRKRNVNQIIKSHNLLSNLLSKLNKDQLKT